MTAHATTVDRLRGGAHRAPLTVALTCAMAWSWPIDAAETTPAAVPSPAAPVNQGAGNPPPTPPATPATVIGVSPQQAPASTSPASQSDQAPASASPEMPAGQAPASASAESPADQAPMTASPPSAADQAGAAPVGTSRDDAIAEFRRRLDAKDYAGAIVQGRHVIAILRQDPATNPEDLQTAMMNLGAVQVLGEDYLGAEETYKSVIAALESQGRMTTPRMARAAAGLANSYYFAKRYELAANAYERAIQLNRRNEGLFNEEQLPLLDRHADSLTALGRLEEALQSLAYGMRIADRRWGSQDQRTIDRLEQLGRWYTRVHAWEAGRQALRSAVRLIEKRSGPYAMELVSPLRGIADSYLSQLLDPAAMRESAEESHTSVFGDSNNPSGMPGRTPGLLASEGERALERAIEIIDHQPHPPPLQVASVHTQMGDWYQTRLQTDRAMPHYRLAWGAAGDAPPIDGQSFREFLFGKPTLLHFDRLTEWDRYAKKPPNEVEPHTVEIDLTVNAEGRVRARKLVSNDGDAHLAEDALEAADTARYRPRFLDGNPVETSDVRLTQTYYQPIQAPKTPEGEPQAPATASPETASSQPAQTPPADSGETAAPAKPADTTPETTAPVTSPERSSTSHAT